MSILWRPLAFLASLALGAGSTFVLWLYLSGAHSLNRVFQLALLFLAFALFWQAAWKYMGNAGSVAAVKARAWVALKMAALGVGALAVLWLASQLFGSGGQPTTTLTCDECTPIQVTRVIDGDTLVSGSTRIRLYGIDAPEVGERCASGATQRLAELAGDQVRIEAGPRLRDVFGRTLGYLYTEDGQSIDELLIAEGHAVAWTRDGQHRDFLVGLERGTRADGVGCLW